MKRIINGTCILLLCFLFTACSQDKNAGVPPETLALSEEDKSIFADELTEMENYKNISDISKVQKIYQLDDESKNSTLALSLLRAISQNGKFQYAQTLQGDLYIFTVKYTDENYRELVYNTAKDTYGIQIYDSFKTVVNTENGTDNVTREITTHYLINSSGEKYIGQFAKNISASETIDVLKKYQGQTDLVGYNRLEWDEPQKMLDENYSDVYGIQSYMRYIAATDDTFYLCTLSQMPEGYCLTYYDPAADWFEVREYSLLIKVEDGSQNAYYLTNDAGLSFRKNTVTDGDTDGFVYIG